MQNEEKKIVDLYIPRKCSATNRILKSKDHSSVQINIGDVDADGKLSGKHKTIALAGFVRIKGQGDACLNRLFHEHGLLSFAK